MKKKTLMKANGKASSPTRTTRDDTSKSVRMKRCTHNQDSILTDMTDLLLYPINSPTNTTTSITRVTTMMDLHVVVTIAVVVVVVMGTVDGVLTVEGVAEAVDATTTLIRSTNPSMIMEDTVYMTTK